MRALVLVGVLLSTQLARAADDDAELARRHYETGKILFARGRYSAALTEFEAARSVLSRPAFDYNIGLCLESLGRREDAAAAFQRFAEASQDEADAGAAWKRAALLRVRDPEQPAVAAEHRRGRLRLAGIAVASVGGALLLSSIAPGLVALRARDDYRAGCGAGACDPALYDDGRRAAIATDALLGVGAVVTAAGVALIGVSAYHRAPTQVERAR